MKSNIVTANENITKKSGWNCYESGEIFYDTKEDNYWIKTDTGSAVCLYNGVLVDETVMVEDIRNYECLKDGSKITIILG